MTDQTCDTQEMEPKNSENSDCSTDIIKTKDDLKRNHVVSSDSHTKTVDRPSGVPDADKMMEEQHLENLPAGDKCNTQLTCKNAEKSKTVSPSVSQTKDKHVSVIKCSKEDMLNILSENSNQQNEEMKPLNENTEVVCDESTPMLVDSQLSQMDTSDAPITTEDTNLPEEFPDTLEGFGFAFNEEGKLRDIKTKEKFKFNVKEGNQRYNQKRYEKLGEIITEYVYSLLEEKGFKRIYLPVDAKDDEPRSFVYVSDDVDKSKKLMIIIHGAGVVRAGQWSRKLIINNSLKKGTQIPFIERARDAGYAVVILNTNLNYVDKGDERVIIRNNAGPDDHGLYVWDKIISDLPAKHIAIVAHSFGGVVTEELIFKRFKEVSKRVFAVALTDSVHSIHSGFHIGEHKKAIKFFKEVSRNWVSSDKPLDTHLSAFHSADCDRVSAGHAVHEMTSYSSIESVFKFIFALWEKRAKL